MSPDGYVNGLTLVVAAGAGLGVYLVGRLVEWFLTGSRDEDRS